MKKILPVLFAVLFCLSSCAAPEPHSASTQASEEATSASASAEPEPTEPAAPVTVSPLAREWIMEPVEKYSWEREAEPEYVLLHFSSNVTSDRKNPCDAGAVREIFVAQEVSANYLVDRDGTIWCLIPEDRCAWHAGVGTWNGEERFVNKMNYYSFGIEMVAVGSKKDMAQYLTASEYAEVPADCIGYTDAQYEAVRALAADLCERHSIPLDRAHVIGHEEYSPSKCDPGELFDWSRVID